MPTSGRREHRDERFVVVAVVKEAQVREQVEHLLLAEVAAAGRSIGRQADRAQLVLEHVRVRARREEEDDVTRCRLATRAELVHAARERLRLAAAPRRACALVALLVGDEELDGRAGGRIREAPRGHERAEVLAELGREQLVDDGEELRSRAVVPRERQDALGALAPLLEHVHVGMPESVDRLKLVADEEQLLRIEQVDQLALEAIRVLELVDHHRPEAEPLALADVVVAHEKRACFELEILEVEPRLALLRSAVLGLEVREQRLEEIAIPHGRDVECRLLEREARFVVGGEPLTATAAQRVVGEIEQAVRGRITLDELAESCHLRARRLGRRVILRLVKRGGDGLANLPEACREIHGVVELELERATGGAQRLRDTREHAPKPIGAVGREQAQPVRILAYAERSRAPPRTPPPEARWPETRRGRESAGRGRLRSRGSGAAGDRSRGWSRSTRRRARALDLRGPRRSDENGCATAARRSNGR